MSCGVPVHIENGLYKPVAGLTTRTQLVVLTAMKRDSVNNHVWNRLTVQHYTTAENK